MGYSPVTAVQGQIANTIRGGLSDLGNRPLEKARFGLEKQQIVSGLARQKQVDEQRNERFRRDTEAYTRQEDELNQPTHKFDSEYKRTYR